MLRTETTVTYDKNLTFMHAESSHRGSTGLTIVANAAIATGLTHLGAPQSFVFNFSLLYARVDIRI